MPPLNVCSKAIGLGCLCQELILTVLCVTLTRGHLFVVKRD